MLDDNDSRFGRAEFAHQFERGISIVEIVIAELLALHLFGLGNAARGGTDR